MSCKTGVLFTFVKTFYLKPVLHSRFLAAILILMLGSLSCTQTDLFEKTAVIPGHSWKSSFKPSFTFTIKDTSAPYMVYFIIRHDDRYSYKNIYVNLYAKGPGQDTAQGVPYDIRLATDESGWLGSGMDDIYEHRTQLTPRAADKLFYFKNPGDYTFTIEQIMREDPLKNVWNTGIRIEKLQ
jgi:gliding motility-associated lipoprotein GldH